MASHPMLRRTPVEVTLRTRSGPATFLGELTGLERTQATIHIAALETEAKPYSEPSLFEICRPELPAAVVLKGAGDVIVDIVAASLVEVSCSDDGTPRMELRLVRTARAVEKRGAARSPCDIPVRFRPLRYRGRLLPQTTKAASGHIVDMSVTGAKLATALRLPIGLRVELVIGFRGQTTRLVADIINDQGGKDERRYGLRFVREGRQGGSARGAGES